MKKLLLTTTTAILLSSPAFAWHTIDIYNETDPVEVVEVVFTHSGVQAQAFPLNLPGGPGWYRTFGPLHEDGGPCGRWVTVVVSTPMLGWATQAAATKMNVCTETTILVSGTWPGGGMPGAAPLIVTHR